MLHPDHINLLRLPAAVGGGGPGGVVRAGALFFEPAP